MPCTLKAAKTKLKGGKQAWNGCTRQNPTASILLGRMQIEWVGYTQTHARALAHVCDYLQTKSITTARARGGTGGKYCSAAYLASLGKAAVVWVVLKALISQASLSYVHACVRRCVHPQTVAAAAVYSNSCVAVTAVNAQACTRPEPAPGR